MQDIALLTDADEKEDEKIEKVSLMTIHQAKGLEFPYVSIVGLEENLFPSIQSIGSRADLEEERRLFYVALTRAEKKVVMSYAESRFRWGNLTFSEPSRFLEEIEEKYLASSNIKKPYSGSASNPNPYKPKTSTRFSSPQTRTSIQDNETSVPKYTKIQSKDSEITNRPNLNFVGASIEELKEKMLVEHQRFGKGEIIKIEGIGSNKTALVLFDEIGEKQLLLRFAKLRIVK